MTNLEISKMPLAGLLYKFKDYNFCQSILPNGYYLRCSYLDSSYFLFEIIFSDEEADSHFIAWSDGGLIIANNKGIDEKSNLVIESFKANLCKEYERRQLAAEAEGIKKYVSLVKSGQKFVDDSVNDSKAKLQNVSIGDRHRKAFSKKRSNFTADPSFFYFQLGVVFKLIGLSLLLVGLVGIIFKW